MTRDIRSTIQKRDDKGVVRHGGEWLAIWSDPDSLRSKVEQQEADAEARAQRDAEASIAATLRSMSGQDVDVVFTDRPDARNDKVTLPHLRSDGANLSELRGQCDARAGWLAHHDSDLHDALRPAPEIEARLFDLLEQLRCEAIEARRFPGMRTNLVAHHLGRLAASQLLNAHLASLVPLAEALRMVCRDNFLQVPEPSIQTAGFRMWDRWLRERFQSDLDALGSVLISQRNFAGQGRRFLNSLLAELPNAGQRDRRDGAPAPDGEMQEDTGSRPDDDPASAPIFEPGETVGDLARPDKQILDHTRPVQQPYHAYTTAHDRVVKATDLVSAAGLRSARETLDARTAQYRKEVARLVGRLQRRIMALRAHRWEFDLDEGMIDAAKLDRVIINPGFENAYKQEFDSPFRDTVVTLLVDNSGSMRGAQIETACVVTELLSAALERCGISTEILGFTTSHWKGGQSFKDWVRAGKPEAPGRLNDLLHIVYKDAATPLRRARDDISAMLSPSILKENIDGEALLWASGRLVGRPERRKILIVLSDGAPIDAATIERNSDKLLLDRHLREMIAKIETSGLVELCAIGIRHDVSGHYPVSRQIERVPDLAEAVVDLLDQLLVRGKTLG